MGISVEYWNSDCVWRLGEMGSILLLVLLLLYP